MRKWQGRWKIHKAKTSHRWVVRKTRTKGFLQQVFETWDEAISFYKKFGFQVN